MVVGDRRQQDGLVDAFSECWFGAETPKDGWV
jgi:hypothetical protein